MRQNALLAGAFAVLSAPALGGEVELRLSGTSFEGGPAFEAALGGEVIGTGTVDEPSVEGTAFSFTVDDALLSGGGDLTLRLTNDLFAAEGQDRSLSVLGAQVGSATLTPQNFVIVADGNKIERDNSAGALIWSENEIAVANPPAGGWLSGGEEDGVASTQDCSAFAELTGFGRSSVSVASVDLESLGPVIAAAQSGACSVTVTGYADPSGSALSNRRITAARAAAVLDQLIAGGARFPAANIVATDGTDDGSAAQNSRRVTVQLWRPEPQAVAEAELAQSPVFALLEQAFSASIDHILILGWQSSGDLYMRSSNTDPKEALWLLEQSKKRVLEGQPVLGPGQ